MKVEEAIALAGAGIAALIVVGLIWQSVKPQAPQNQQQQQTPPAQNPIVQPISQGTGQSGTCLW